MICLRCGYCCQHYFVQVVDDPSIGIEDGNIITLYGDGTRCPHLQGDTPGEFSCGIHNEPWYDQTPCFEFTQIEQDPKSPCRMGEYILSHPELLKGDPHGRDSKGSGCSHSGATP